MAYLYIKAFHIISVIAWMAGLFYLPRLFVYHTKTQAGSESYNLFLIMEQKLFKIIMVPSSIATWLFGALLVYLDVSLLDQGWFIVKLLLVSAMTVFHLYLGKCAVCFRNEANAKSEKFYRMINEIPTLLMFAIVFLVVLRP